MSEELAHNPTSAQSDTHRRVFHRLENVDVETVEAGVTQGVKLLQRLKKILSTGKAEWTETTRWVENIETILKEGIKPETVIGVVGPTGSGKSALLNALLDEEQLVPTNCMRACTAVMTRIAFQDGDDPYRACIEFISSEEWEKDLRILMGDMKDDDEPSEECEDPETLAAIAYAKIKAVYPTKSKKDLVDGDVSSMLQDVFEFLGCTKEITETNSLRFSQRLGRYVDSKEETIENERDDQTSDETARELWPLIREVRLYVKASALSTGAVIVDLPGVQDSDAARTAVDDNCLTKCTDIWIVSPIARAVDGNVAKSLLGESFKRQLILDNNISSLTFICSKTDDISYTEAAKSLGLTDHLKGWNQNIAASKKELDILRQEKDKKSKSRDQLETTIDEMIQQFTSRDAQKDSLESPFVVKRKGEDIEDSAPKRQRVHSDGSSSGSQTPKMSELRTQRNDIVQDLRKLDQQIKQVMNFREAFEVERATKLILGRNQYSKDAIRRDFLQGLNELNQDLAAEDEKDLDPSCFTKDYQDVTKSLPVFCVSARAYQKLAGCWEDEESVPGFAKSEHTEISELRAHCVKLTENRRLSHGHTFLNELTRFLNSLTFQIISDDSQATAEAKKTGLHCVRSRMDDFDKAITTAIQIAHQSFKTQVESVIFPKLAEAANTAAQRAPGIVGKWNAPLKDNGLSFQTYKAHIRQDGVYTLNWNKKLIQPMIRRIDTEWQSTFGKDLGDILKHFTDAMMTALDQLRTGIRKDLPQYGLELEQQIPTYKKIFQDLSSTVRLEVLAQQKLIHRRFEPTLQGKMKSVYLQCAQERGNNSFARMKHAMSQHVEHEGDAMFRHTAQVIQDSLKALLAELKDLMSRKVVLPSHKLQCDCCAIVGVQNLHSDDDPIAKPGLQTRETILRILNGVDIAGLKIQSAGPTEHDAVGGVPLSENSADHGNLDIADLETQPEKSIRDDRVDDMSVDGVSVDGESVDGGSVDGRSVDDMIVDDME